MNRAFSNSISVFDTKVQDKKLQSEEMANEFAWEKVIQQIKDRRYAMYLKNDGRSEILYYGLCFIKKMSGHC